MLLTLYPFSKALGIITLKYGYACLNGSWAAVEFGGDKVHCYPVVAFACIQRALMGVQALVFRQ